IRWLFCWMYNRAFAYKGENQFVIIWYFNDDCFIFHQFKNNGINDRKFSRTSKYFIDERGNNLYKVSSILGVAWNRFSFKVYFIKLRSTVFTENVGDIFPYDFRDIVD